MKVEWGKHVPSMVDIIWNPSSVEVARDQQKRKQHWVWSPSVPGFIKVNIDGSLLEESGIEGIRGVFGYSNGRVLI